MKRPFTIFGLLALFASALFQPLAQDLTGDSKRVYFIPFQGEVEIALFQFLSRGFDEAESLGADHIVFEMDTPGGRVDAALSITDLILESAVPVTVYVSGDATSAGAIISAAAQKIIMRDGATIGTAAPVLMGQDNEVMNEKSLSYVLAQVRAICEKRGYDEQATNIILAMIDSSMRVTIPDPENPDEEIVVSEEGSLLTLTANEALEYGLIEAVVDAPSADDAAAIDEAREKVVAALGAEGAERFFLEETVADRAARFLSSVTVSSLLLTVAFLGIFTEFRSPGFGIPGIVGLIALVLFFFGHSLTGLAGFEGPLLFMIGLLLLSAELFLIPGFGLAGIAGILCIVASVIVAMLDAPITSPEFFETFQWADLTQPLFITTVAITIGAIGAMASPLLIPVAANRNLLGNWLLLNDVEDRQQGYHSSQDGLDSLLGAKGVARSVLRPAGIAEIEGKRIDVVSQGGYIANHTAVEVVQVEGRRVVVRAL